MKCFKHLQGHYQYRHPLFAYQAQIFVEGRLVELVHDELDLRHGCVGWSTVMDPEEISVFESASRNAEMLGAPAPLAVGPRGFAL